MAQLSARLSTSIPGRGKEHHMPLRIDRHQNVYHSKDVADKTAAQLSSGEDEGWTYTVQLSDRTNLYVIAVRDEDNEFVAYWSR
jgi:hypothetical protein